MQNGTWSVLAAYSSYNWREWIVNPKNLRRY